MPVVSVGTAAMPAPKRPVVIRKPSDVVVELTQLLATLPADGQSYLDFEGKSAKGVALVAGKVAAAGGFAIRTDLQSDTIARIWKIALTPDQIAKRDARKAAAKIKRAEKEAANLAELKA